uniref:Uncharacterized protein n=1 Tax=Strigamia maritima TaxID=126957 RepID=T1JHI7_STRMM
TEQKFARFDRSNFDENGDPQENWLDSENRKLLSLRSARLIRELGRKRGSLEKNFLRFGRSLENGNDINTKRDTSSLDDSHMSYLKSDQLNQNKLVPKRNKLENNFLRFGRWKTENLNEQYE